MSSSGRDDHRSSPRDRGRGGRSDSYGRYDDYYSDRRDFHSGRGYESKRAGRADEGRRPSVGYDGNDDYARRRDDDRSGRDRSYSGDSRGRGRDADEYYYGRDRSLPYNDKDDGRKSKYRYRSSSSTSDYGEHKRPKLVDAVTTWPPPFDQDGALYVFDARSGFFYEAESDFFYDPKTKLYYSNKKATYYQYVAGEDPPFRAVAVPTNDQQQHRGGIHQQGAQCNISQAPQQQGDEGTQCSTGMSQTVHPRESRAYLGTASKQTEAGPGSKMKIAISLKTKTPALGGGASAAGGNGLAATASNDDNARDKNDAIQAPMQESSVKKQHAVDIAKWSDIQREKKSVAGGGGGSNTVSIPTTTKTGQPICLLCRRKFASLEKLQQHELMSALHKNNVAKKEAAEAEAAKKVNKTSLAACTSNTPSIEYRDRAKDRRSMYGPDFRPPSLHSNVAAGAAPSTPLEVGPSLDKARVVSVTETVKPVETLGDTNIGSKMLQKLGWKKGALLGRQEAGSNRAANSAHADLVNDWEKIESAAKKSCREAKKC